MSLLNRISSGLLVRDYFNSDVLDPMWQVSPSDDSRYSLTEKPGSLRLKHGDPDLFILMNSPRSDFVMELDTDYDPIRASDQGGIAIYRDKDTRLELLEYYDPATGMTKTYDRLRVIKRADLYEGYGSNDNGSSWELIGTSFLNAPKIGIVLHGLQEGQSDTLDVSDMRMYKSTNIQVGNLLAGQRVELVDELGKVLGTSVCAENKDYVDINGTNLNFPISAKICIYDTTSLLLAESEHLDNIWGGDIFWYGLQLDIEINEILLRQDREYQLGNMTEGIIEQKAYIVNNNDVLIPNVKATVAAYSEYFGWQWVDIAIDAYGQPGVYQDNLILGTINPGQRIPIWIKVIREPHQQVASLHDYKFRILLESR